MTAELTVDTSIPKPGGLTLDNIEPLSHTGIYSTAWKATAAFEATDSDLFAAETTPVIISQLPDDLRDYTNFMIEDDTTFIQGLYQFGMRAPSYDNLHKFLNPKKDHANSTD